MSTSNGQEIRGTLTVERRKEILLESLIAAIPANESEAKGRMNDFLAGKRRK